MTCEGLYMEQVGKKRLCGDNKQSRYHRMKILMTGGVQRSNASKLGEGRRYKRAMLCRLDWDTGALETLFTLDKPNEHYPDDTPNMLFTSSTLDNDKLYLCSETEIFIFQYPQLKLLNTVSYPFFHNMHHVTPVAEGVAVASTGLDLVVILDRETLEPVKFLHALGKDPWSRFSRDVDYRKVHSTKPHEAHPNYIFSRKGELWATRFNQKDAVCLTDQEKRIDIGIERVHDGHLIGDHIYFTCVNGFIVIVNSDTLKIDEVVDLGALEESNSPLGWCRGLAIEQGKAYVGFSKIRKTAVRDNVKWLFDFVGAKEKKDTRVVEYDLETKCKVTERLMPKGSMDTIYSVILDPGEE